jgi:adenine deaminase
VLGRGDGGGSVIDEAAFDETTCPSAIDVHAHVQINHVLSTTFAEK